MNLSKNLSHRFILGLLLTSLTTISCNLAVSQLPESFVTRHYITEDARGFTSRTIEISGFPGCTRTIFGTSLKVAKETKENLDIQVVRAIFEPNYLDALDELLNLGVNKFSAEQLRSPFMATVNELLTELSDINMQTNSLHAATRSKGGYTALMIAARYGYTDLVAQLLVAGADVNLETEDGTTALMLAARGGHSDVAILLIKAHANVNISNGDALREFAKQGNEKLVTLLLAAGADVNARPEELDTALMLAIKSKHNQIVTQLIAAGADINVKLNWGNASEELCLENGDCAILSAACCGNMAVVQELLAAGAVLDAKCGAGLKAFIYAIIRDDREMFELLINAGVDINGVDGHGYTPLMFAKSNKRNVLIARLLTLRALEANS